MQYNNYILDIEGTVCPISFVKEQLFPYFLEQLPTHLEDYEFPLNPESPSNDEIQTILTKFDENIYQSKETLINYIYDLVKKDIKDPVLKQLQGFIWEKGYTTGSILAPLYQDAIKAMETWPSFSEGLYIYSSGSVKAQKLLFANVKTVSEEGEVESTEMNGLIDGYFDTVNIGPKLEASSYTKILGEIGVDASDVEKVKMCLFLSDNPLELKAAKEAGLSCGLVVRPGNYPITDEDRTNYTVYNDFESLMI